MTRYATRSRLAKPRSFDIDDDTPLIPNLTVDDHEAVFTGLLDASGEELFRLPNPIGFGRDKEW